MYKKVVKTVLEYLNSIYNNAILVEKDAYNNNEIISYLTQLLSVYVYNNYKIIVRIISLLYNISQYNTLIPYISNSDNLTFYFIILNTNYNNDNILLKLLVLKLLNKVIDIDINAQNIIEIINNCDIINIDTIINNLIPSSNDINYKMELILFISKIMEISKKIEIIILKNNKAKQYLITEINSVSDSFENEEYLAVLAGLPLENILI